MGLSAADTSGAIRAVNQMISKGTVSAEELRGQLGERLPGAFQIAARAMKVSTEDLGKMLEQGELMADEFLPRFGRQIRQELGGQVESATKRAAASFQRMGNAWFDVKVNLAKSGLLESLAYVAEVGSEFLKNTMAAFEGLGLGIAHASESLFAFGKDQERLDRVFENQRRRIQEKYGLIKKEAEEAGTAGAVAGEKTAAGLDKATQSAEGLATELQRMGDTTAKALDPALKALGDLDKALESQHQKQAKLREKIFKTVGGAAGGYFRDQLQTIRKEAKEMLGASIAEADVSAYVEQQLNKLRQQLDRAGAWSQSSELGGIQAGSIVSELSADLDQSSTEADKLKQQMTEVAQAISKAAGNLREMLPDGEAQQVMARLDLLLEQLQAVSSEADIQANVDTLQAMMAVKRIQHELAGIPREIVTIHRIVRMGSGPVPAPPKGSRAVGGLIPDDGYYLMHKGERVVSNSYGDFNFNFPSGSMSQAEARAFVRGVVIPELQAAGR
ncbi:hypothetical protein BOW51_02585 [Solemya velesiana gill symbiont]|uniref:Tape measure protein N-terminal domain-containing protein n=2 Tax=Solemya velesiana gill symbiont TaxID=1918948 RepID=A0A1T2KX59_9GAMM|nr:hypothetical protein BOW51_02585 [Solemya velesiana gill symbiont]